MLTKKQGWESRFNDLIMLYYELEFTPGQNCCFMFMSDAYDAICGESPISEWRGKFDTSIKGLALYRKNTGTLSYEPVFQWLTEVPNFNFAQRGDMGIWTDEDGKEILGVVAPDARNFLIRCEDREGLVAIKLNEKIRLWRAE